MNFKERKQLEENLLKNIYKNLKSDLEKIGKTSFNYEDFGAEIKVDDTANNYRTIYIFFDNKQMHEIYMGLLNDVNVLLYATSKLDWNEMRTIRWELEGKNKKA